LDYHTCSPDISSLGRNKPLDYYKYEQTNDAQVQEYVNPVIARAGGFIVAVKFEENQNVKKGDTLLVIDNREYILQQEQTRLSLLKHGTVKSS
jgi:membrane fusion protein (multidrug efflux system)